MSESLVGELLATPFPSFASKHPLFTFKNISATKALAGIRSPPRSTRTELYLFTGETGTGKTASALQLFGSRGIYCLSRPTAGQPIWFDGVDPEMHRVLLIDDFSAAWSVPVEDFLRWADLAPVRVKVHYATSPFRFETVVVTSNTNPSEWWPEDNLGLRPFWRRVTRWLSFLRTTSVPPYVQVKEHIKPYASVMTEGDLELVFNKVQEILQGRCLDSMEGDAVPTHFLPPGAPDSQPTLEIQTQDSFESFQVEERVKKRSRQHE